MRATAARLAAVLAAFLALAGCSSIEVSSERDPEVDLETPRTFAWMMEQDLGREDGRADKDHIYAVIAAAVEDSLAAKGWIIEQNPDRADFLLAFQVDMEKQVAVTTFREYDRYPWSWRRFYGSTPDPEVRVWKYDVGTLIVDVVRPQDQHLAWRGVAKVEVDPANPRSVKTERAREVVARLFRRFP